MKKLLLLFVAVLVAAVSAVGSLITVNAEGLSALSSADNSQQQKTTLYNTVVAVKFNGSDEFLTSGFSATLEQIYNTSELSMKSYFEEVSLGKLDVTSNIYGNGSSITLELPLSYYLPAYEEITNTNGTTTWSKRREYGYDNRYYLSNGTVCSSSTAGALRHVDSFYREQLLVREVVKKLKDSTTILDTDGDDDGIVDALSLIIDTSSALGSAWDSLLWPHMSYLYTFDRHDIQNELYVPSNYQFSDETQYLSTLADDTVRKYNILPTSNIFSGAVSIDKAEIGLLCHEFSHTLGVYDYYSYEGASRESVGELGLMASNDAIPQYLLSYTRERLGFLTEGVNILPLESSGSYKLYPVSSDNEVKAYKLVLNDYVATGEYFMLEVRGADNGFDSQISEKGLIIYRINEKNGYINSSHKLSTTRYGNMYGGYGNDEIYIYRCGDLERLTLNDNSTAILNGDTLFVNSYRFNKSRFGSTDKTKSKIFETRGGFLSTYLDTCIFYSDNTNSGIALSNIVLNQDGSVNFDIKFEDDSAAINAATDKAELKNYYDGSAQLSWSSASRAGTVEIFVFPYDNSLTDENGNVNYLPTTEELESGSIKGLDALYKASVPISFKQKRLPSLNNDAIVYTIIKNGNDSFVQAVGIVLQNSEGTSNFGEFIWKNFGTLIIVGASFLAFALIVLIILAIMTSKRKKMKLQMQAESLNSDTNAANKWTFGYPSSTADDVFSEYSKNDNNKNDKIAH